MTKPYRVATVACPATINDFQTNIRTVEYWVQQASLRQAQLILFPEMNITGYATDNDIEYCHQQHYAFTHIGKLAQKNNMIIAAGMAWRDIGGPNKYITHTLWLPNGENHLYHKTHLGGREAEYFAAGNYLPVFSLEGVKIGIMMCLEHHFPDIAQTLVLRGAQLILCPHATPRITAQQRRDSWKVALRARAYDNCTYIVACNMQGDNGRGLKYAGGAMIVDPTGKIIQEDFTDKPAMLVADLDFKKTIAARMTPQGMCRRYYAPARRLELYD